MDAKPQLPAVKAEPRWVLVRRRDGIETTFDTFDDFMTIPPKESQDPKPIACS